MIRICVCNLLLAVLGAIGYAQNLVNPVFQHGEELRYKVKWNFLRLGTITIRTLHDSTCTRPEEYKIIMKVESNPDLHFVWIREFNESLLDTRKLISLRFHALHRNGDDLLRIQQGYDTTCRVATFELSDLNTHTVLRSDTLREVSPFVEGPSLFMVTRCLSRRAEFSSVPTMVDGRIAPTDLNFLRTTEELEVGAMGIPVRVRKFLGVAHWKGGSEAGMSGEFTGWITDDEAAVPVKADMKVMLGSVRLELESWCRPGWLLPTDLRASTR